MKSKASATPMMATTASRLLSIRSGVLDDDAFEDVGDVLAAIRGLLEEVQDLLPLDDDDGVLLVLEEGRDGGLVSAVRLVFETIDLDGALGDPFSLLEGLDRADDLHGGVPDEPGQLARAGPDAVDVIQADDR